MRGYYMGVTMQQQQIDSNQKISFHLLSRPLPMCHAQQLLHNKRWKLLFPLFQDKRPITFEQVTVIPTIGFHSRRHSQQHSRPWRMPTPWMTALKLFPAKSKVTSSNVNSLRGAVYKCNCSTLCKKNCCSLLLSLTGMIYQTQMAKLTLPIVFDIYCLSFAPQ